MIFELHRSEALQTAANKLKVDDVRELCDCYYEFDTNDPEDCRGLYEHGLEAAGVFIQKILENPERKVWVIDYNDYCDNDGGAYFAGTEDEVLTLLTAAALSKNSEDTPGG